MSTGPKRQNFPTGLQILGDDMNDAQRYGSRALLKVLRRIFQDNTGAVQSGVLEGWTLTAAASGALALDVSAGVGFLDNASGIADTALDSTFRWVETFEAETDVALDAADPSDDRIDLIYVQHAYGTIDTDARNIKDPGTGVKSVDPAASVTKGPVITIGVVTGTPAGSPSAPAAPANSIVLGQVTVPAGATVAGDLTGIVTTGRTTLPTFQRPGVLAAVEVAGNVDITGGGSLKMAGSTALTSGKAATIASVTTTGAAIIGTSATVGTTLGTGQGITVATGGVTATAGDITATAGDIRATAGTLYGRAAGIGTTEAETIIDPSGNADFAGTVEGAIFAADDKVQAEGKTVPVHNGTTEKVTFTLADTKTPGAGTGASYSTAHGLSGFSATGAKVFASWSCALPDAIVSAVSIDATNINWTVYSATNFSGAESVTVDFLVYATRA